jgi:CxxC motif-containing protein (DUF1111 family)
MALVLAATTAVAAQFGDPLPRLTPDQAQRFLDTKDVFEETEDAADGLGPVFNNNGCAACHNVGATGGGSALVETRFGTTTNGAFDPLTQFGGSLIQSMGIGVSGACNFTGEVVPAEATIQAGRRTTPLFGLGLVDAVPDVVFKSIARNEARFSPSTAGRPNMVTDVVSGHTRVGKFGWKSQVPNLMHFSGDAYLNEMGITSPLFPNENCPGGDCTLLSCDLVPDPEDDGTDVEAFHDFMTLLGPPPRARTTFGALIGSLVFDRIGCDNCHVRSLTTGPSRVAALAFKTFQPFSDFLLHDMGSLGDGIEQGLASGNEMRTAPLWGIHIMTSFLHDGRATTIQEAILAHDGQGRQARNRFVALPAVQKARLLAFLNTL